MTGHAPVTSCVSTIDVLGCWAALTLLDKALVQASELDRDDWQFAVELEELRLAGIGLSDLRWLLSQGYVQHAEETSRSSDHSRTFNPVKNLSLSAGSCFVLTTAGREFLEFTLAPAATRQAEPNRVEGVSRALRPCWDAQRRELLLGSRLVKRFRVPAHNQEKILAVLEEEDWPARIDDPLSPEEDCDALGRLRDTIKALNRKQINRLIVFSGDGTGRAVLWRLIAQSLPETSARPSPLFPQSKPCAHSKDPEE